jgi:hypothetical protein
VSDTKKFKSDPLVVYAKDGIIRCCTLKQSGAEPIIENEWKQTAIIDPAEWIEAFVNNAYNPEIIKKTRGL